MYTLDDFVKEQLQNNPEFAEEYERTQPTMDIISAVVNARNNSNLTQKELSEKSGIHQSDISKLENGTKNPTIKLLQKLADAMEMTLQINFVPKQQSMRLIK